ncbi:mycothiol transferase [Kitasatospora griseola]|uniref:mycothiol transferase n=1 Tax=Kitasatospora griseola TaxID=2064 RepID=UPI00199D6855|nr:DUF664 domain-containing protein [Kitasatospora griseola]GGQ78615.1 hypothetical protein GCM10010195_37900 [Kitasatospora griseola]
MERHWFRRYLNGETLEPADRYWYDALPDGDFALADDADPVADTAARQEDVACTRATIEGVSLDTVTKRPWRGNEVTLRWLLFHLVEEYTRHNSHANLLRKRIVGAIRDRPHRAPDAPTYATRPTAQTRRTPRTTRGPEERTGGPWPETNPIR